MSRGGKRPGAGRKRKLTPMQCLQIGARCEREHRSLIAERTQAAIDDALPEYLKVTRKAKRIPASERRAWLEKHGEDYFDDVEFALREDQRAGDEPASRLVSFRVPRPKGERDAIIEKIAAETGLTKSRIARCWTAFRAMEEDLAADDV